MGPTKVRLVRSSEKKMGPILVRRVRCSEKDWAQAGSAGSEFGERMGPTKVRRDRSSEKEVRVNRPISAPSMLKKIIFLHVHVQCIYYEGKASNCSSKNCLRNWFSHPSFLACSGVFASFSDHINVIFI